MSMFVGDRERERENEKEVRRESKKKVVETRTGIDILHLNI